MTPVPAARGARPTLTTLARELGVSPSTVFNAFNRPDQLSPALRERVLAAARAAGFGGPDPVARSLRRGSAGAIGLLFTESLPYAFTDPAAVLTLQGVATAGAEARVGLLLLPTFSSVAEDQRTLSNALVDGLVIHSMYEDARVASARARGLPLVVCDQPQMPGVPFVGIDDRTAARRVAEHVAGLGHRRIGIVLFELSPDTREGPADLARQATAVYETTSKRLAGYRDALEAAGLAWPEVPVHETPRNDPEFGRRAAHALLDGTPRPTALLCASDVLALGARQAARERGLGVPGELSIAGFDDIPEAARAEPALTTIRQPHVEKGARTARRLLALVGGADVDSTPELLPTELVVRGSTGPPPY